MQSTKHYNCSYRKENSEKAKELFNVLLSESLKGMPLKLDKINMKNFKRFIKEEIKGQSSTNPLSVLAQHQPYKEWLMCKVQFQLGKSLLSITTTITLCYKYNLLIYLLYFYFREETFFVYRGSLEEGN